MFSMKKFFLINLLFLASFAVIELLFQIPNRKTDHLRNEIELILAFGSFISLITNSILSNQIFQNILVNNKSKKTGDYSNLYIPVFALLSLIISLIAPFWNNNMLYFFKLFLPGLVSGMLLRKFLTLKYLIAIFFFSFLNSCFFIFYLFFVTTPLTSLFGYD